MTIALRPLRNPNPLGFPGGVLPGFDPMHVASVGINNGHGFSAISANSNFISLLSGAKGGTAGTAKLLGSIGPTTTPPAAGSAFSGQSTANDTVFTTAAIANLTATNITSGFFVSDSASSGVTAGINTSGVFRILYSGVAASINVSAITLATNTPYFLAASKNATSANFVVLNLATGRLQTAQSSGASGVPVAPGGSYLAGLGSGNVWQGSIAAVMFSPTFLSLQTLTAWAQDPWSFWYPRKLDLTQMLVGASGIVYTLAGAEGVFTISGQAASIAAARRMPGVAGTFTISGQAAAMLRGIKLGGAEGAFVISGDPATIARGITLGGAKGSFTINGQAATITKGRLLSGVEGAFAISGSSAAFPVALSMKGSEGAFTISGGGAVLTYTPQGSAVALHSLPYLASHGQMTAR